MQLEPIGSNLKIMIRNYLKVALRNLLKKRVFSIINILGLSLGMLACMLILQYVSYELSYEDFNDKRENVYRVSCDFYLNNHTQFVASDAMCYNALGPASKESLTTVKEYARLYQSTSSVVKINGQAKKVENLFYADPAFADLMSVQWLETGSSDPLDGKNKIAISKSTAQKWFPGEETYTDKIVHLTSDFEDTDFVISSVFEDVPENTHVKYDVLVSYQNRFTNGWKINWNQNNEYVYMELDSDVNLSELAQQFQDIYERESENDDTKFIIQNISDIHLYSHKDYEVEQNGDGKAVYLLLLIAVLIIIIAWVNYINLTTSKSMERAKEVGIRKTLGSQRHQLIGQFLSEAFMLNLLSFMIAITMAEVLQDSIKVLLDKPLSWSFLLQKQYLLVIVPAFLIGVTLSGFYPAFVLSASKPAKVLKGNLSTSSKGSKLRKGLVALQFFMTIIMITGTLVIYKQMNYMLNADPGVNVDQVIVLNSPTDAQDSIVQIRYESFKNQLLQYPEVVSMASASALPGTGTKDISFWSGAFRRVEAPEEDAEKSYYVYAGSRTLAETIGMQLVAGRYYSDDLNTDLDKIVINEKAAEKLGYNSSQEAIGKSITWGSDQTKEVIGIVKNYNHHGLSKAYDPMIIGATRNESGQLYYVVKTNSSNMTNTLALLKENWQNVYPEHTMDYFFLDDKYAAQYDNDRLFSKIFLLFCFLIVVISCLGLFGLTSYTVAQRTKEIGIRKVLGASVGKILQLLTRELTLLILFVAVVATPVAYYLMNMWLDNYAFKVEIRFGIYTIPAILILLIVLLTIGFHTYKAATADPVKSLKYE